MTAATDALNSPRQAQLRRRRRVLLGGGAAVLAAVLGGAAWWRGRTGDAGPAEALWALRLPTPQGGELALADWRGQPLLVNFWATWCTPCLDEMPMLDHFFHQSGQRLAVVGLALDRPEAVTRFLQRLAVRFPVGVLSAGGLDLTRQLGNSQGGLPFSVLLGSDGRIQALKTGQLSAEDLARWARG